MPKARGGQMSQTEVWPKPIGNAHVMKCILNITVFYACHGKLERNPEIFVRPSGVQNETQGQVLLVHNTFPIDILSDPLLTREQTESKHTPSL